MQATETDENEISEIINAFLNKIKENLKLGEKEGRALRTSEKIIIAAHFTSSRTIKNSLN